MKQIHQFNNDDEWYTRDEDVEMIINNFRISKDSTIWCPFDKEESAFVRVLKTNGYKVIYSHIDDGKDFFNYEPSEKYDLILSNPPFYGKAKILQRLIELNKPFGLIFGIQCFNSGEFVKLLNEVNNLQFCFLSKRLKFHKGNQDTKLPSPTFHSLVLCNDLLDKKIKII